MNEINTRNYEKYTSSILAYNVDTTYEGAISFSVWTALAGCFVITLIIYQQPIKICKFVLNCATFLLRQKLWKHWWCSRGLKVLGFDFSEHFRSFLRWNQSGLKQSQLTSQNSKKKEGNIIWASLQKKDGSEPVSRSDASNSHSSQIGSEGLLPGVLL